jgi:predicted nucleic acid-binding protein
VAGYFLDSSALVKVYHAEAGSAAVEELALGSAVTILISRLSVVEVQSAFAGKVRAGVISAGDAAGLRRRLLEDIANGVFGVVALTSGHFDQAGEPIERYGPSHGLRTLDSLQLAVALSLHRRSAIENFVAADKVLCKVADVEGIPVIDPESTAPEMIL